MLAPVASDTVPTTVAVDCADAAPAKSRQQARALIANRLKVELDLDSIDFLPFRQRSVISTDLQQTSTELTNTWSGLPRSETRLVRRYFIMCMSLRRWVLVTE